MTRIDVSTIGGPPVCWAGADAEIRIIKGRKKNDSICHGSTSRRLFLLIADHLSPPSESEKSGKPDLVVQASATVLDQVAEAIYALALPEMLWIGADLADFLDTGETVGASQRDAKAYVFKGPPNCYVADAIPTILNAAERQNFNGKISLLYLCADDFDLRSFDAFLDRALGLLRSRLSLATATLAKEMVCTVVFVMKEVSCNGIKRNDFAI